MFSRRDAGDIEEDAVFLVGRVFDCICNIGRTERRSAWNNIERLFIDSRATGSEISQGTETFDYFKQGRAEVVRSSRLHSFELGGATRPQMMTERI